MTASLSRIVAHVSPDDPLRTIDIVDDHILEPIKALDTFANGVAADSLRMMLGDPFLVRDRVLNSSEYAPCGSVIFPPLMADDEVPGGNLTHVPETGNVSSFSIVFQIQRRYL